MLWIFGICAGVLLTALTYLFSTISYWFLPLIFFGYTIGVIALVIIFVWIMSLMVNQNKPLKKVSKFYSFLFRLIDEFVVTSSRVKIKITNKQLFTKDRNYLIICNHRSNYDPMVIIKAFRWHKIAFASKPQNFSLFIVGNYAFKSGCLPINRDDNRQALKSIIRASELIQEDKIDYAIFPEGQRNFTDELLLPFRKGALKIAQKAKCPVIVMTLWGTENVKKNFPFKSTKVNLDILKVIEPEEFETKTTNEIADYAHKLMLDKITEYSKNN